MKERHLIVMRPNQYNGDDLRLGLLTSDFREYVQGKNVQALYINFYAVNRKISSIRTYVNEGSIVKKNLVSTWLHNKGFAIGTPLLFELVADNDAGIHIYNFLGTVADVTSLINNALSRF